MVVRLPGSGASLIFAAVELKTIVVLEGDETGQELLEESLRVLAPDVIGLELELPRFDLSLAMPARDVERGRARGGGCDPRARAGSEGRDGHARRVAATSAPRTGSCVRRSAAR